MFSSKSDSSSSAAYGETQSNQAGSTGTTLAGLTVSGGGKKSQTNVNITSTDHGAVEGGLALGAAALSEMRDFGSEALYFADRAGDRQASLMDSAMSEIGMLSERQAHAQREQMGQVTGLVKSMATGGASDMNKTVLWVGAGVLLLAGVLAVTALRGKR